MLTRYAFNRRGNVYLASRSCPDHPERLPPDKLPTVNDTQQKSKSSSETATTTNEVTSVVIMPILTATRTIEAETMSTMTGIESETTAITTMESGAITTISIEEMATTISTEIVASFSKCSKFYLACRGNNIEEVKELLKTITLDEIDRIEPNGSTALHAACYHGHQEIVKLLLRAGADRALPNKHNCLPFDEALNDEIKELFFRVPNTNRLVSNTGAIEWESINDDVLETAAEERHIIKSLYDNTSGFTSVGKMFEKIERNYINKGLAKFDGIDTIKRFFKKATEEQDPRWILKAYTAETDFYKVLNTEIACGASRYQNERRYIIALLWHHPKLNEIAFTGSSYRVMQINYDDLRKYQTNCSLMTKSFLSSSIDRKLAELFLLQKACTQEPTRAAVRTKMDGTFIKLWVMCVYNIKHRRTALHIENSSQYANEGEILIMPYTVFKVKRINHIKPSYLVENQTMTEIELEECDQYFNIQIQDT
ncbi:unnamed protein product [Rotaria sordida]|uniref:NAD(+)--protein-arginine ADP-ribosyltransferase n=1 Tax=Rotaria sordida TaxID=392033 RepID=A0A814YHQ5_9BILA|nr:unnamed protein product [Rotaria sordida]CAF1254132.1 unnamed protein product [Rotaria sordida]CAF3717925.1 unnamed protein product [Rotaria sordida]CAF4121288.1 unnamed protein product [Rotaria sordida]